MLDLRQKEIVEAMLMVARDALNDAINELDTTDRTDYQLIPGHLDDADRYMKMAREICKDGRDG